MAKTKDKLEVVEPGADETAGLPDDEAEFEARAASDEAPAPTEPTAAEAELERQTDERMSEIAVREPTFEPLTTIPGAREWSGINAIAERISRTPFVPDAFRGRPEAVAAAILTGRELGVGPMQALKEIAIIEGRPAPSAQLMLALLRRGGVQILESSSTAERAWIRARRADTGEVMEVEWTKDEADKVMRRGKPLTAGDNWRNYPADMLWARAVGRLARRLGGDLTAGFAYTSEEVQDFDVEGEAYEYGGTVAADDVRRDGGADAVPVPRNMTEVLAALRELDPDGQDGLVDFWVPQAMEATYGKRFADMNASERQLAGQKAASLCVRLAAVLDPNVVPPATRKDIADAVASVFDGNAVEGPPWRLSPDEADRPTLEEWTPPGQDALDEQAEAAAAAEGDADDEAARIADEAITGPKGEGPA